MPFTGSCSHAEPVPTREPGRVVGRRPKAEVSSGWVAQADAGQGQDFELLLAVLHVSGEESTWSPPLGVVIGPGTSDILRADRVLAG